MSGKKDALILTEKVSSRVDNRNTSRLELALEPAIGLKADKLKNSGISRIFVAIGESSSRFREKLKSLGTIPLKVPKHGNGILNSFSALTGKADKDVVVMKASRIYPEQVLKILINFELDSDFLLAVDTDGSASDNKNGVVFSDELVRPSVKRFGKRIEDPDALEIEIYLSSPISFHESVVLVGEGKSDINALVESLDSRVLPFSGVNCIKIDSI